MTQNAKFLAWVAVLALLAATVAPVYAQDAEVEDVPAEETADETAPMTDYAFVLLHKSVVTDDNMLVVGSKATIKYTVYNAGNMAAFDVSFEDTWDAENFEVEGTASHKWEELGAGESASVNVTIVPKNSEVVAFPRAVLSYRFGADNEEKRGLSSTFGPFRVLTHDEFVRQTSSFVKEWTVFACLVFVPILLPFLNYRASSAASLAKVK